MQGRRGCQLMQRAASEPAAKRGVDRGRDPDETLLAGKAGGVARIDTGQGLAEAVQRVLWRSGIHEASDCSCFVLKIPEPHPDVTVSRRTAMSLTRPDLAGLPVYVPGRSVPGAIKLSSNEVPFGPLPGVV